jgi:chromosome segregation ATPase
MKNLAALELQQSDLVRLQNSTSRIMVIRPELTSKREQLNNLTIQLSSANPEIDHIQSQLQKQKYRLKIAERLTPLRVERAAHPSFEEQKSIVNSLSVQLNRSNLMLMNYSAASTWPIKRFHR